MSSNSLNDIFDDRRDHAFETGLVEMTRRRFLQWAVGGAAVAASELKLCSTSAAQGDEPARIGFGFSLYGMRSVKLPEALAVCADIGYSGVELACMKDWPCDPASLLRPDRTDIRSRLQDLSLDLPALMENLVLVTTDAQHQSNLERLKNVCQLGHDLSPDQPLVVETVLGGKPSEWDMIRGRMVDSLRDWEKVAASQQTVIAIKAHISGALHTPQDAVWLAEQVNSRWIKLVYDYSHFQRQKLDLAGSLAAMQSRTVFVHIKDNVVKAGATGEQGVEKEPTFEFALPGNAANTKWSIDYADYLTRLKQARYRGTVMVEVSAQVSGKPDYDPIAAAKRSYENIHPAFIKAGLRAQA